MRVFGGSLATETNTSGPCPPDPIGSGSAVVSHHKLQNVQNHGRSAETLPFIRNAMRHQCIALDCYPYTAGSTMIRTDRGMLDGRVLIASSVPHPGCAGRDLADIAAGGGSIRQRRHDGCSPEAPSTS